MLDSPMHAGDSIDKTLTFTLAPAVEASRITLLLTRASALSEHPTIGRARCVVLESQSERASAAAASSVVATGSPGPRARFQARLHGVIPASICGGTYMPVFCTFTYEDGRPPTGFEIDADQRFTIEISDDASSVDPGPSICGFV